MESRIKDVLKEKGITMSVLADMVGTSQTSLSRALGENGNPTYETLSKIAVALNVPFTELFAPTQSDTASLSCPHCGKSIQFGVK